MKLLLGLVVPYFASVAYAHAGNAASASAAAQAAALQAIAKELSPCAVSCLAEYVPASGCAITDTECICTNTALATSLAGCLGANCTVIEALETQRFQETTCGAPVRSSGAETTRIMWALYAVAMLAIFGRFGARAPALGGVGFGWDDWTILVNAVILTVICVVGQYMINSGLGKDMWMLQPYQITSVLRYFWVEEMLYSACVSLTKISILLLYLRIFSNQVSTVFRQICFGLLVIVTVAPIVFIFTTAFQCTPVNYSWLRWDAAHEGHCINSLAQIYAGCAYNTFFDLVIFVLPIPRLLDVQITNRRKIGICLTFLVGLFTTLCSIIRLTYIVRWRATTNPTWTYNPIALWSLIECEVGIICACMPALAGPITRFWMFAIGDKINSLYETRKARKSGMPSETHSRTQSSGWRSRSQKDDKKPNESSIMCNVSLNVSDEMELMDKKPSQGTSHSHTHGGIDDHGYRQKW